LTAHPSSINIWPSRPVRMAAAINEVRA